MSFVGRFLRLILHNFNATLPILFAQTLFVISSFGYLGEIVLVAFLSELVVPLPIQIFEFWGLNVTHFCICSRCLSVIFQFTESPCRCSMEPSICSTTCCREFSFVLFVAEISYATPFPLFSLLCF